MRWLFMLSRVRPAAKTWESGWAHYYCSFVLQTVVRVDWRQYMTWPRENTINDIPYFFYQELDDHNGKDDFKQYKGQPSTP